MTDAQVWNVAGIVLATLGVIGLFFFGAPFRVRGRGRSLTFITNNPNKVEDARDRVFDFWGWMFLVAAVSGAGCQIVAALG